MKKIVLFLLIGFSVISFSGCNGNIVPIVQDVCEITTDICNYANLLCSQFEPEVLNKSEQDEIKAELLKIKETLQAKLEQIQTQADLKKNSKEKYFYLVDRLKNSVNEIESTIKNKTIIANEIQ